MSDSNVTLRCPECDTYSGTFSTASIACGDAGATVTMVHSICGREGSPESFIPGTPEFEAVYNPEYPDLSWGDEGQGADIDDELEAANAFLDAMSVQSWGDIAPVLTCREVDAAVAFLTSFGRDRQAEVLLATHAASDEEDELHYQGDK